MIVFSRLKLFRCLCTGDARFAFSDACCTFLLWAADAVMKHMLFTRGLANEHATYYCNLQCLMQITSGNLHP